MKIIAKVNTICLLLFFLTVTLHAKEYSLEEYLTVLEANNTDIQAARKETELAKQTARQTLSALLPSVGLQGGYDRTFEGQDISLGVIDTGSQGLNPLVTTDPYPNQFSLGIGVQQKLLDTQAVANHSKAKKAKIIRETALEAVRNNVVCAAKKLYAQTQLALMVADIRQSSEDLSREVYDTANRKYQVGSITELELLMAEVDWKMNVANTTSARKDAELALTAFKNLAGIPLTEKVSLSDPLDSPLPDIPAFSGHENESGINGGVLVARPDYRALVLSRELADIGRKSAYALFAPTLSASYSWGKAWLSGHDKFMGADFPDANATSSKLSLTATIPLFAGGARVAAVKAAGIEQEKANIVLNQKQRDIEAEFIELRLRFAVTQEKLQSARTIEEMALRAASLAQSSYTNGVATLLSLSEAQDKLAAARLGLANALYECRCVYYDWLLATGQE